MTITVAGHPEMSGAMVYGYDGKRRLNSETFTGLLGYTQTYAMDAAGNLLTYQTTPSLYSWSDTSTFSGADSLNGYQPASSPPQSITYDPRGNPTGYRNGLALGYDQDGHLTSATGTTGTMTAGYSADGRRIWKLTAAGKTFYLYAGDTLVGECLSGGTLTAMNMVGPTGLLCRWESAWPDTHYYLYDPLGNVVQRLGSDGETVLSVEQYDAWGRTINGVGDPTDPIGYKGLYGYYTEQDFPDPVKLILCTHRYYDPCLVKWDRAFSLL